MLKTKTIKHNNIFEEVLFEWGAELLCELWNTQRIKELNNSKKHSQDFGG